MRLSDKNREIRREFDLGKRLVIRCADCRRVVASTPWVVPTWSSPKEEVYALCGWCRKRKGSADESPPE